MIRNILICAFVTVTVVTVADKALETALYAATLN